MEKDIPTKWRLKKGELLYSYLTKNSSKQSYSEETKKGTSY
jgi:hypothetical protein